MITNTTVWVFSAFVLGVSVGMLVAGAFWNHAIDRIVGAFEREMGEKR